MEQGGRADKIGNRYERLWVVEQLLKVLCNTFSWVKVEPIGQLSEGVDLVAKDKEGLTWYQQCKQTQQADKNWTLKQLKREGVLKTLKSCLEDFPDHRFLLVSDPKASQLHTLAQKAKRAANCPDTFYQDLIEPCEVHQEPFGKFCEYVDLNPNNPRERAHAFDLLKRTEVQGFAGGKHRRRMTEAWANQIISGNPPSIVDALFSIAASQENFGLCLTESRLRAQLANRDFKVRLLAYDPRVQRRIKDLQSAFKRSLSPLLVGNQLISRPEGEELIGSVLGEEASLVAVVGRAGAGKSCVLLQLVQALDEKGIVYLPLRLDQHKIEVSPEKFGVDQCGLPESPSLCLAHVAADEPAVLILDQLDALTWTTAAETRAWNACVQLIEQAMRFPNIAIVVACRAFDWEAEPRFVEWAEESVQAQVQVTLLEDTVVKQHVEASGIAYSSLSREQRELLQLPLGLYLWNQISHNPESESPSNLSALIAAYFEDRHGKLQKRGLSGRDIEEALSRLQAFMAEQEVLHAPARLLREFPKIKDALQSLDLLRIEKNGKVRFCHQSYFEFLRAEALANEIYTSNKDLLSWVLSSQQLLSQRQQLRLVLELLGNENPKKHAESLEAILAHPEVRFHLKHLALQVLLHRRNPTPNEVQVVLSRCDDPTWLPHLWRWVFAKSSHWFTCLDDESLISQWLSSDDQDTVLRALSLCRHHAEECSDRVAELLSPYLDEGGDWPLWIANTVGFAGCSQCRDLFELQLLSIERGLFSKVAFSVGTLSTSKPLWFLEAIDKGLERVQRTLEEEAADPGPLLGKLSGIDFSKIEEAATLKPRATWELLLPRIKEMSEAAGRETGQSGNGFVPDKIWGTSWRQTRHDDKYSLLNAASSAAAILAESDPGAFTKEIDSFTDSDSWTVQRLAARILTKVPVTKYLADHAISWLLADKRRLRFGPLQYESSWKASKAILSRFGHSCSDQVFERIVSALSTYHDPFEWVDAKRRCSQVPRSWLGNLVGITQYVSLSSLPDNRLSHDTILHLRCIERNLPHHSGRYPTNAGHVLQKGPGPMTVVGCPLSEDAASSMSAAAWKALIRLESKRAQARDKCQLWGKRIRPISGHHRRHQGFARRLRRVAEREPRRFSILLAELPRETHPAFVRALIRALSRTKPPDDCIDEHGNTTWQQASAESLEIALSHHKIVKADAATALSYCHLIRQRPDAPWSDQSLKRLRNLASSHPHPGESFTVRRSSDSEEEHPARSLQTDSLNCVRGTVARAIGGLISAKPARLGSLTHALETLARDPSPAVRCGVQHASLLIFDVDHHVAWRLFTQSIEEADARLLTTRYARLMLTLALENGLENVSVLLEKLAGSSDPGVAKVAFGCAVASFTSAPPGSWPWAGSKTPADPLAALACRAVHGGRVGRIAAATIAADLARTPDHSQGCMDLLSRLMKDHDAEVRNEAMDFFRYNDSLSIPGAQSLLSEVADTCVIEERPEAVVWAVQNFQGDIAQIANPVLSLARAILDLLDAPRSGGNLTFDAKIAAELVLRLYRRVNSSDTDALRERCLDVWDEVLRVGVFGADKALQEFMNQSLQPGREPQENPLA